MLPLSSVNQASTQIPASSPQKSKLLTVKAPPSQTRYNQAHRSAKPLVYESSWNERMEEEQKQVMAGRLQANRFKNT